MNSRKIDFDGANDTQAGIADALLSYMVDCRFTESHLNAGHLVLALEYVYQPRPRFWQDLSIDFVVDTVTRRFPNWLETRGATGGGLTDMLQVVQEFLRINAFDEGNAQKLLTLPKHLRPADPASALTWLCAYFVREELWEELELAERDGNRCGSEALDVVYLLEQSDCKTTLCRTGTLAARAYRDSAAKRQAELAKTAGG
jgi:hypothetical protein